VSRRDDQLTAHLRRLGNHALNELLLQLPKPRFAALVEVALARPVLPAGLMLRFEPTPAVDGWTVVACAPRRQLGTVTRHQDPSGQIVWRARKRIGDPVQVAGVLVAASAGCRHRAGLGHAGQWGPLPGPGRLRPRPGRRPGPGAAGRAAPPPVRPAGGGGLRASGDGGMTAPKTKRCPRCAQVKPTSAFYRRGGGTRTSPYCQPCTRAASRQARDRRRRDPASAELLRAVERVRQRRRRALPPAPTRRGRRMRQTTPRRRR